MRATDTANIVKEMIKTSGKTQAAVSSEVGKNVNFIAMKLSRQSDFKVSEFVAVAKACGYEVIVKDTRAHDYYLN